MTEIVLTDGDRPYAKPNGSTNGGVPASQKELRALANSILLERVQFMRQHGLTFAGARDEYEVFGYDRIITTLQYRSEYARGGIAGRIVDCYPNDTWRGEMEVIEDENPDVFTEFEKAWDDFDTRLQVRAKLHRVDKLSQLGTYAVLLIGAPGALETELPKGKSSEEIVYLQPFLGGMTRQPLVLQRHAEAGATLERTRERLDGSRLMRGASVQAPRPADDNAAQPVIRPLQFLDQRGDEAERLGFRSRPFDHAPR